MYVVDLIYRVLLFVKYNLQSIILLIVYVVLMNLFVDKIVATNMKLLTIVYVCCVDEFIC